jgi:hypothetical protein
LGWLAGFLTITFRSINFPIEIRTEYGTDHRRRKILNRQKNAILVKSSQQEPEIQHAPAQALDNPHAGYRGKACEYTVNIGSRSPRAGAQVSIPMRRVQGKPQQGDLSNFDQSGVFHFDSPTASF